MRRSDWEAIEMLAPKSEREGRVVARVPKDEAIEDLEERMTAMSGLILVGGLSEEEILGKRAEQDKLLDQMVELLR